MTNLTESAIEQWAIELLQAEGYHYIHGPDIAPDGELPERAHYGEVLLTARLEAAVQRINPKLLAKLRDNLLPKLMNGEARVTL